MGFFFLLREDQLHPSSLALPVAQLRLSQLLTLEGTLQSHPRDTFSYNAYKICRFPG